MPQTTRPEGGLRNYRPNYIRESEYGVTPADPDYLAYSKSIQSFTWTPDASLEPQRSIGVAAPTEHIRGAETHELELTYNMNKWFEDDSGNPHAAEYDALFRDNDNIPSSSHTIVVREAKGTIAAANTLNGATARPVRLYTVARGAWVDEAEVNADPDNASPVRTTLSYAAQKARSFQIDQPTDAEGSVEIAVQSTSSNDTSQTVTVEEEDPAGTSVSVTLSGTTPVDGGGATFADIDRFHVDAETEGDVELYVWDSTNAVVEDQLSVIRGTGNYRGMEGDLGIPPVGAGSIEDPSTLSEPETSVGNTVRRGGTEFDHEIPSVVITAANNVDTITRSSSLGMATHATGLDPQVELDVFGENASHELIAEHLEAVDADIEIVMNGSAASNTLTLKNASLAEPGERAAEEGQTAMIAGHTFEGAGDPAFTLTST